jgi:hypothetical protein
MALIIVVATTHFYVVATEDTEWRQFLSTLPEDSKLLYNMVSDFHHSFPSKTNAHANSCSKEGYFEYLTAYVGVGFWVEHPPGCFLKSGGLLMYTKEEEKWISNLNFRGKTVNKNTCRWPLTFLSLDMS